MNILILLFAAFLFSSCAMQNAQVTRSIQAGMSVSQVEEIMGDPVRTEIVNGNTIYVYSIHEPWVGVSDYYVVFEKGLVTNAIRDTASLERNQKAWESFGNSMQQMNQHNDRMNLERQKLLNERPVVIRPNPTYSCTTQGYGSVLKTSCQEQ